MEKVSPNFVFLEDEETNTHEYLLDGKRLLSVTQVLKEVGLLNYPDSPSMNNAKIRGTYVHTATEMIDRGTLDWDELDESLVPYCKAYQSFLDAMKGNLEYLISEKPMYHPTFLYAGKPDRIAVVNGVRSVIDIKTGAPHPTTELQIAAYAELARAHERIPPIPKGFCLYLRQDGTYRLAIHENKPRNLQTFQAALTVARWKEDTRLWKEI